MEIPKKVTILELEYLHIVHLHIKMYQVTTRKARSHCRVASLSQFQKMPSPRKYTNSKFTALPTKLREDWEVLDGSLEGKQCIYFSPYLIWSSYVAAIQMNVQTLF